MAPEQDLQEDTAKAAVLYRQLVKAKEATHAAHQLKAEVAVVGRRLPDMVKLKAKLAVHAVLHLPAKVPLAKLDRVKWDMVKAVRQEAGKLEDRR